MGFTVLGKVGVEILGRACLGI